MDKEIFLLLSMPEKMVLGKVQNDLNKMQRIFRQIPPEHNSNQNPVTNQSDEKSLFVPIVILCTAAFIISRLLL